MSYKGKLEIRTELNDSWIVVSFIDSGIRIPKEIEDKIFEPFFTTKKHGEGIGIGLGICKKIITNMGGKIEFESNPGKTRFSVWLKSVGTIQKRHPLETNSKHSVILCVDDEPIILLTLKQELRNRFGSNF